MSSEYELVNNASHLITQTVNKDVSSPCKSRSTYPYIIAGANPGLGFLQGFVSGVCETGTRGTLEDFTLVIGRWKNPEKLLKQALFRSCLGSLAAKTCP